MTKQINIIPDKPNNRGLDYSWLKQTGLDDIQRLSGEVWTDYNEHDPGVTTLEQLCYALTELSYRAELPLEDLLMREGSSEIDSKRQALFKPVSILPCNPVTINDYSKLIVDRIKAVANVWLTPCSNVSFNETRFPLNGLYRIAVYVPDVDECGREGKITPEEIKNKINHLYNQHRELCEDIDEIIILKSVLTNVRAIVTIGENQSANIIMAKLWFKISLLLAPEIRRNSLQEKIRIGQSTDSILEGPLLHNGLIDDKQFKPKAQFISVNDIVKVMLQTEDVVNVSDVEVIVENSPKCFVVNEDIPVLLNEILKLDTQFNGSASDIPIILIQNGIKIPVKPIIVQRELDKIWKQFRTTYNLGIQYEKYFSLPSGNYTNLGEYYSIQNQYPDIYGINQYGIAEDETIERHAQAKQLKGYLLVFDQILANYFSQLEHVKDLYSIDPKLNESYFYQYLNSSVPDIESLLKKGAGINGYHSGLPIIIKKQDPFTIRRNKFLSTLLAIYGQSLDYIYVPPQCDDEFDKRLINAKLMWLSYLVSGTCKRGQGIDYLDSIKNNNIAGMQIKVRIQLGMNVVEHRPFTQVCSEMGVEIVKNSEDSSLGKKLETISDDIEDDFGELSSLNINTDDELSVNDNIMANGLEDSLIYGNKITQEFFDNASCIKNYRIGRYQEQGNVSVLCQSSFRSSDWYFVKQYKNAEIATKSIVGLVNKLETLKRYSAQLYFVEHILLRYALLYHEVPVESNKVNESDEEMGEKSNDDSSVVDLFNYNFTLSVVITASYYQINSESFRTCVYETVQQNSPANIQIMYCFIDLTKMCLFEKIYWSWRRALKKQDRDKLIYSSFRLKQFLMNNTITSDGNDVL